VVRKILYRIIIISVLFNFVGGPGIKAAQAELLSPSSKHDFHFKGIPKSWDEGIPLGNGMMGALIWQRGGSIRLALDRADLWDLQKIKEFERPEFRFSWVADQVKNNNYGKVQELFDVPYDRDPAPTKIPAGAIELLIPDIGNVESVTLRLRDAACEIRWQNNVRFTAFVHATEPRGWFYIEGLPNRIKPRVLPPPYGRNGTGEKNSNSGPSGNDLRRLNYPPPVGREKEGEILYHQECADGFAYDLWLGWTYIDGNSLLGCWTITPNKPYALSKISNPPSSGDVTLKIMRKDRDSHADWWNTYWGKSSIQLPDSILEIQWYREMYKFGCTSRRLAPPITLQAVWTADNGRLPPWKGDFHNDLNTQLSYWPAYSSNHTEEGLAFLDWLWYCKPTAESYTRTYFGVDGLNFPGVSTLSGDPIGGWIQYSLGPTVSAWLAQHFYLHWQYTMDRTFLEERAYPWISEVARYLDALSIRNENGERRLPLSSSPEIHDNDINAWFPETTNFDLALIGWLYQAAAEMAREQYLLSEANMWDSIRSEWPSLAVSEKNYNLLVAPGVSLLESHRHFSHLMAIHPLGLLDWERSDFERWIIEASLKDLERLGTDSWCGYSYSWLGNLYARSRQGDKAAEALRTFSTCFCLANSFHVNGDQSGTGKSKFTYRPFTLEGNFACAAGIQEMLLQSYNGLIRVFPAIPESWNDVAFENFRAEGAFLVSAVRKDGILRSVSITSEEGRRIKMLNPFKGKKYNVEGTKISQYLMNEDILELETTKGMHVVFYQQK
jgi:alpha-L-fucosidase 2